jgi:hypothetical protein
MEETHPEAAAVLREAGWAPHDTWGVFTQGTLVMGSPRVGEFRIKNIAHSPDGPDTPDDPVAAALWLVAHEPVETVSEPEETPEHEAHEETGAEESGIGAGDNGSALHDCADGGADFEQEALDDVSGSSGGPSEPDNADFTDADFYESTPAIEGADLGAEILDEGQGQQAAYIFGDNLDQKRTAAIGLVVQIALSRMPAPIDYAQLSELRNFTMGVSEGRWPDDPAKRDTLETLEANERARRSVEAARDAKTAFLVTATREQIEGFDPESDWP